MTGLFETFTQRIYVSRLLFLLLGFACVFIATACFQQDTPSESEAQTPAPAAHIQSGEREIPVQGSLVFPNTESVSFESPGIVGEVLVSEGESVQKGQLLASLNSQNTAQLQTAVAAAQVRVTTAQNNLDSLLLTPPLLAANAELEVANAEVAVVQAHFVLEDLSRRPGVNSEQNQLAVVQAEITLDDARERLEEILSPKQIAVSAAESRVAAARVELDSAQDAYDDIKDGTFPEEMLRDAQNRIDFATTALEIATRTKPDAEAAAQNALIQSQDAEYYAREQYIALFKYWFGTELTEAELQMTSQEVIAEWGIDLDETFRRFNPDYANAEPTADNPATRWFEPTIWAWVNLHPQFGGVVPICTDEQVLAPTQRCITRELDDAYDALDTAQDALAAAVSNVASTADQTDDAIAAAEAGLEDAQDALEEVEEGPDASAIESAEKRVQLAQASLKEAEDDLAELTVDIDPLNITLARAAVVQAEVALEETGVLLDRSLDDSLLINQANKQLALASTALINAETTLASVEGVLRDQIGAAEAELTLAQETLNDAQEALDGAVMRSPIDGIVSIVNIEVDDPVNDQLTAIEIIANDVVEIDGVIDASGRSFVQEGASAIVTIESIGDTTLGGSVSFISKEARTERGVISYAVRIRVDIPQGVSVPISLSAISAVIIGSDTALNIDDKYRQDNRNTKEITAYRRALHSEKSAADIPHEYVH